MLFKVFPFFTTNERMENTMSITEKSAYIKGLADGLELDKTTKEGKIIAALLDLVDEMATEIADLQIDIEEIDEDLEYLNDYIEEIDEDLGEVEEILVEDDECDCDDCDCTCDDCDCDCELEDEDFFEIDCPSCGETVCFDESIDPEDLVCPACGEKFECIVSEDDLKALDGE